MQSCQAATPRRAKPVTPLNIKLSVGRRRLLHTDGKQMSLLAAVSAPHAPPRGGAAVVVLAAAGTNGSSAGTALVQVYYRPASVFLDPPTNI